PDGSLHAVGFRRMLTERFARGSLLLNRGNWFLLYGSKAITYCLHVRIFQVAGDDCNCIKEMILMKYCKLFTCDGNNISFFEFFSVRMIRSEYISPQKL